jgi:hypothetical protein
MSANCHTHAPNRHSRVGGNLWWHSWIPACAGMTALKVINELILRARFQRLIPHGFQPSSILTRISLRRPAGQVFLRDAG